MSEVVRSPDEHVSERSDEPIVLLHAFPLDGRMWADVATELERAGQVIAPDLAGFGEDARLLPETIDAHADEIARELDACSIARATVIGLSMGGYVALALLKRHPRLIARLGLAGARAQADSAEARAARDTNIALVEREGVAALVERMLPKLLSEHASTQTREAVRRIATSQRAPSVRAALAAMRDRPDTTSTLVQAALPCAIIVGEHDAFFSIDEARQLVTSTPHAQLEVIAGAGHLAPCEQPTAFARAVQRLYDRR